MLILSDIFADSSRISFTCSFKKEYWYGWEYILKGIFKAGYGKEARVLFGSLIFLVEKTGTKARFIVKVMVLGTFFFPVRKDRGKPGREGRARGIPLGVGKEPCWGLGLAETLGDESWGHFGIKRYALSLLERALPGGGPFGNKINTRGKMEKKGF